MKKLIILLIVFSYSLSYSQDTLRFSSTSSNTKFNVVSLSKNVNDIHKINTWFGFHLMDDDMLAFGGTSFYIPKKALFKVAYGTGARYQGSVFLFSKTKKGEFDYLIKTKSKNKVKVNYPVELPTNNIISVGVHYGAGISDMFKKSAFSVTHGRVGLTFLKAKYGSYLMSLGKKRGKINNRTTVNIDMLYYFDHYRKYNLNGSTSFNNTAQNAVDYRKIGFGVTLEGYLNKASAFGFKYMFGVSQSGFYSRNLFLRFGVGLNLSFCERKKRMQ